MNLSVNARSVENISENEVLLGYSATTVRSGMIWNVLALTKMREHFLISTCVIFAISDNLLGLCIDVSYLEQPFHY